jgi:thiamine-phosphate pyrophosphorylase
MTVGRLHLITNLTTSLDAIEAGIAGGVDVLHLRDHAARAADLLLRGRQLRERFGGRVALVVNDRLDVALALSADGAQLTQRSLPVAEARRVARGMPLGASVHSVAEAEGARGADWLLVGTVFPSATHPGGATIGVDGVRAIAETGIAPLVAIGGVEPSNVAAVRAAGAHGVAVISAILSAKDPRAVAEALR